jgi:hypothetical protein
VTAGAQADPISTSSTLPEMPFYEPGTALASMIGGAEGNPHSHIYLASCGVLEHVCLFSITNTKAQ